MRRSSEKGASLVEASFLIPMLILLAVGLSEIGFLVVDYLTVSNSAREGARTGAAAANFDQGGVDADDLILAAVEESACNLRFGQLEQVRIFKADADGAPISGSGRPCAAWCGRIPRMRHRKPVHSGVAWRALSENLVDEGLDHAM